MGGGQEINTGEAGLPEWFDAVRRKFSHWNVYVSNTLSDSEYTRGTNLDEMLEGLKYTLIDELHLSVSLRSFRSERVSEFVKAILNVDKARAKELFEELKTNYPIVLTRNITEAKDWVKKSARGSERYGIIASSGATRLKPFGIWIQSKIDAKNWFLKDKDDVRSSYFLEDTATEFDIQGLELDWTIVAWDANFRFNDGIFTYHNFSGRKWNNIKIYEKILYLKNAYRVLLTRARQGMVIFVPEGDDSDLTRAKSFYDGTYNYLKSIGITEL
nr:DUF2075 domain-containing protein [Heliophilum fasciatum]